MAHGLARSYTILKGERSRQVEVSERGAEILYDSFKGILIAWRDLI